MAMLSKVTSQQVLISGPLCTDFRLIWSDVKRLQLFSTDNTVRLHHKKENI